VTIVNTASSAATTAHALPPPQRLQLARAALSGRPITELAQEHDVSRKFVYQQAGKAEQALAQAFATDPATVDPVLFALPVTELWLKRLILALLLIGHSSYRGVAELLRDLFHCPRSLGYIHAIARAAWGRARALNQRHALAGVRVGAHDELFQAGRPVLVGVDVASTYCYLLSPEAQRDGVTWGVRLLELQDRGFAPQAIIGDGGSGLQAGQALALPDTPRRGDVFHVLREVGAVVTALESRAYQALAACVHLEHRQSQSERTQGRRDRSAGQRLRQARPAAAAAVAVADDVATLAGWLRRDILALAGPGAAERHALYDFVVAELRARAPQCPHRLGPLCTYLVNQRDAVLAFAQQLDADLGAVAADYRVPVDVVRAVLHVQQFDVRDRRRWPAEAALRQQLRGRFYEVSAAVAAIARGTVRASSVVENLNSRLRNYFFLRRHLGPDYVQLLQFFLNHRRFLRSEHPERVGRSPAELLTGQVQAHWLELLGLPDPLVR
jgi:hypothetical protein